jgi:hypothetical protein
MTQSSSSSCSNCGTTVPENMRFCPNCGTPAKMGPSSLAYAETQKSAPSPAYQPQLQQAYQPASQGYPVPLPGTQPPPVYAQPQKNGSGKLLGKIGCGVGVAILLVVLLLGTAGYFGYRYLANRVTNAVNSSTGSGSGGPGGNTNPAATPVQAPIKTSPVNATVTYAGVDLTILDVQQSANRLDDPNIVPNANGSMPEVVRLDFKEHNTGTNDIYTSFYTDGFRLLLSGTNAVAPAAIQKQNGLAADVSQTNWLDFSVPTGTNVSQAKLQLGTDTEAQMTFPLTANPDTSQYQSKSFPLTGKQTQFSGLSWEITTATLNWSTDGTQATKGMRYLTLSMKVNNPSTSDFNAYTPDITRIKTGDITSSTIGGSFGGGLGIASGSSGKTGDFLFLVPQDVTAYTFILLDKSGQNQNGTIDFQLQ